MMSEDTYKTIRESVEQLLSDFADLNVKVVNLANKLEDHMKEADAHNPAMMHKKKIMDGFEYIIVHPRDLELVDKMIGK